MPSRGRRSRRYAARSARNIEGGTNGNRESRLPLLGTRAHRYRMTRASKGQGRLVMITAMNEYTHRTLEQLRLEDYGIDPNPTSSREQSFGGFQSFSAPSSAVGPVSQNGSGNPFHSRGNMFNVQSSSGIGQPRHGPFEALQSSIIGVPSQGSFGKPRAPSFGGARIDTQSSRGFSGPSRGIFGTRSARRVGQVKPPPFSALRTAPTTGGSFRAADNIFSSRINSGFNQVTPMEVDAVGFTSSAGDASGNTFGSGALGQSIVPLSGASRPSQNNGALFGASRNIPGNSGMRKGPDGMALFGQSSGGFGFGVDTSNRSARAPSMLDSERSSGSFSSSSAAFNAFSTGRASKYGAPFGSFPSSGQHSTSHSFSAFSGGGFVEHQILVGSGRYGNYGGTGASSFGTNHAVPQQMSEKYGERRVFNNAKGNLQHKEPAEVPNSLIEPVDKLPFGSPPIGAYANARRALGAELFYSPTPNLPVSDRAIVRWSSTEMETRVRSIRQLHINRTDNGDPWKAAHDAFHVPSIEEQLDPFDESSSEEEALKQ